MATTQIFVNLPVQDLVRSLQFFAALGYRFDPQFTNQDAACMIVEEGIYVMLLTEGFFRTFCPGKQVCDTGSSAEVLVCLTCPTREHVDDLVRKAVAAGGSTPRPPQDQGFMYGHAYEDLDGHIWELIAMTPPEETAADAR
jgi:predicted lactoylglutathione lyase